MKVKYQSFLNIFIDDAYTDNISPSSKKGYESGGRYGNRSKSRNDKDQE